MESSSQNGERKGESHDSFVDEFEEVRKTVGRVVAQVGQKGLELLEKSPEVQVHFQDLGLLEFEENEQQHPDPSVTQKEPVTLQQLPGEAEADFSERKVAVAGVEVGLDESQKGKVEERKRESHDEGHNLLEVLLAHQLEHV